MKTFKLCCFALIVLLLFGCRKGKKATGEEIEFAPGDVIIGLYDSTSFQETCSLILYDLDLFIRRVHTFKYTTVVEEDSLDVIKSILNNKEYLSNEWYAPVYIITDSVVIIELSFFNFGKPEATDWFGLVSELSLVEDLSGTNLYKFGILTVPEGSEEFWVNELGKYEIIKWVELNYIGGWSYQHLAPDRKSSTKS